MSELASEPSAQSELASESSALRNVLLINPPLWNPYAPHLAVPLLTGVLKRHGIDARGVDLSAETMRLLLARSSVERLIADRSRDAVDRHAELLFDAALGEVDRATAYLRSPASITDFAGYRAARNVCQAVLGGLAAWFPGSSLSLDDIKLAYRPGRSTDVIAAAGDRVRNPYLPVFEQILAPLVAGTRVVGISVSADTQLIPAITAAAVVRRLRPEAHITLGGNFTTRIADRLGADHPFLGLVDSVVQYEGEESLVEVVNRVERGVSLVGVPGVLVRERGVLHRSPPSTVDLTELPPPDFGDFPLADGYLAPGPVLPLMASRSCAWKCAFCSIPFASDKFRLRRAEAVVSEMDELHRRHGVRTFQFVDEIMTVRSLRELAEPLAQRSYRWYGETRFHPRIDAYLARALYTAGCRRLDLGLESYNQDVLDRMRKEIKASWIEPNLDALLSAGVSVHLFCIAGFPGEARWQTARTIRYARDAVASSARRYGVAHSSYGVGPFVLDALSPVATAPSSFQVEIFQPGPGWDLEMGRRYRYTGNLPQPVSDADREMAAIADRVLGLRSDGEQPPEEVMFLRASQVPAIADDGVPEVRPLGPQWMDEPLTVGRDVALSPAGRGTSLLLRPETNAVLAVPARLLFNLPRSAAELARDAGDLRLLAACVRLGLYRPVSATGPDLRGAAELHDSLRIELEVGVELHDGGVLCSEITGECLRLSASGQRHVRTIIARGGCTVAELNPVSHTFLWRLLEKRLLAATVAERTREEVST